MAVLVIIYSDVERLRAYHLLINRCSRLDRDVQPLLLIVGVLAILLLGILLLLLLLWGELHFVVAKADLGHVRRVIEDEVLLLGSASCCRGDKTATIVTLGRIGTSVTRGSCASS
jgi:hypothetical protein